MERSPGTIPWPVIPNPRGPGDFIGDLVDWGRRAKLLSGIRPWAPDLPMPGWAPMSLFERYGASVKPRLALDAFRGSTR